MNSGTASAFARLIFLPAMDPIVITTYPLRYFLVFLTYSAIFHRPHPAFSYLYGGNQWNGTCRNGSLQSPIHLETSSSERVDDGQPLIFINYDLELLQASVSPHTLKFEPRRTIRGLDIGIAGGGLRGFYMLDHIHLHWSGSEHHIDDNQFKMEAHFVHFRQPVGNETLDETIDKPDGIAVLAVLYEWGEPDELLDQVITQMPKDETSAELHFAPSDLLPNNTNEFFRYRGSLTTPPCTEVVIWTVFTSSKCVAQYQINWLRTKKLAEGHAEAENYRIVQPMGDRIVRRVKATYVSNNIEKSSAKSTAPLSMAVVAAAAFLVSSWSSP